MAIATGTAIAIGAAVSAGTATAGFISAGKRRREARDAAQKLMKLLNRQNK